MILLGRRNEGKYNGEFEKYKRVERLNDILPVEEVLEMNFNSKDMAIFDADDETKTTLETVERMPYNFAITLVPNLESGHCADSYATIINGKSYVVNKKYYDSSVTQKNYILDDLSNIIAFEMVKNDKRLLIVNIDIKRLPHESFLEIMKYILEKYLCSLMGVSNIEALRDKIEGAKFDKIAMKFAEESSKQVEQKLVRAKDELKGYTKDIEYYKDCIIQTARKIENKKLELKALELSDLSSLKDKVLKEFSMMKSNPKILNVNVISGEEIWFETPRIYAYDENGNRYKLNRYKVTMNFKSGSVRFYGLDDEYNRKGCWTEEDPHPHVDGAGGRPCLGSIASTIAELISAKEIYALSTICINYLESVNTEDYAGKYVRNWECVDEDGNSLENPINDIYTCKECGSEMDEDNVYSCDECGEDMCCDCSTWIDSADVRVCDTCRDENYSYCEECSDYVRDTEMCDIDGESVCVFCRDESGNFAICQTEGEWHHIDNMFFCEECENYHHDKYRSEFEGNECCEGCSERLEQEKKEEIQEEEEEEVDMCDVCGDEIKDINDATTCLTCYETIHKDCAEIRDGMTYCDNGEC